MNLDVIFNNIESCYSSRDIKILTKIHNKKFIEKIFYLIFKNNDIETIEYLAKNNKIPNFMLDELILFFIENDHYQIFYILNLDRYEINEIFLILSHHSNTKLVKYFSMFKISEELITKSIKNSCIGGNIESLDFLLRKNNYKQSDIDMAFDYSIIYEKNEISKYLLCLGADIYNALNSDLFPYFMVNHELIRYIAENEHNLNKKSFFETFCKWNCIESLKFFLENNYYELWTCIEDLLRVVFNYCHKNLAKLLLDYFTN
jgi:ankyrin repeat protein